jgi:hypothetical protein
MSYSWLEKPPKVFHKNLGLFINVQKGPIIPRDIVNNIKGIFKDEYLLAGLEYSIQYFLHECWRFYIFLPLLTWSTVSACYIKTLTNPFRSLVKELLAAFRKPPMTIKINSTLKLVLKKRPVMACIRGKNGPMTEKERQNRKSYTTFGDGDGWL